MATVNRTSLREAFDEQKRMLFFALGRNGFPRLIRSEWDKISHALPDLLERSLFVGDFSFPAGV